MHVGTHMHIHTHTTSVPPTLEQCVCARFLCTMTRVLTIIPPDSFLACRKEVLWSHFHHFLFFPPLPLGVQRSLSSGISMFVLWLCMSARPWLLYQTGDSGFSSSVLDQRPTISKAASLSQCLSNVCPCSGTENVDTVPKVPLQVPPSLPSWSPVITRSGSRTFSIKS